MLGILIDLGSDHLKVVYLQHITESNYITVSWFSYRKEIRFPSVSLQNFLAFAGNTEPKFAQYFKDNYCNRIEQWAPCFIQH